MLITKNGLAISRKAISCSALFAVSVLKSTAYLFSACKSTTIAACRYICAMTANSAPSSSPVLVEEIDTSNLGFLSSLTRAPCFRDTALYSIGGSGTLAALHFHRNRDVMRSAELMVKSGVAFATLHWFVLSTPSSRIVSSYGLI